MMVMSMTMVSCGESDDFDDEGVEVGKAIGSKMLKIDGEAYYCGSSSEAQQTNGSGMYLKVYALENPNYDLNGHILIVHIPPSKVAELKSNDVFRKGDIIVRNFYLAHDIEANSYRWKAIQGDIRIGAIKNRQLTIEIEFLVIEHKDTGVRHTIDGSAILMYH